MKALFFSLLIALSIIGCNSQPTPASTNLGPTWILNPNQDGKVGAIGVAARTYDQKISTQRKLAITRALDELSLQKGVKVNLNINKQETLANGRNSIVVDAKSNYTTNSTVTAHIQEVYKDVSSGELYVWMVMD
jgi:hypothetical protein